MKKSKREKKRVVKWLYLEVYGSRDRCVGKKSRTKRRLWVHGGARRAGTCFSGECYSDVWSSCLAVFRARRQREAGKVMSWLALARARSLALPAPFVRVLHVGLPSLQAFLITIHTHARAHENAECMHKHASMSLQTLQIVQT